MEEAVAVADIDPAAQTVSEQERVNVTRPDNFNQLRSLITRLLREISVAA